MKGVFFVPVESVGLTFDPEDVPLRRAERMEDDTERIEPAGTASLSRPFSRA